MTGALGRACAWGRDRACRVDRPAPRQRHADRARRPGAGDRRAGGGRDRACRGAADDRQPRRARPRISADQLAARGPVARAADRRDRARMRVVRRLRGGGAGVGAAPQRLRPFFSRNAHRALMTLTGGRAHTAPHTNEEIDDDRQRDEPDHHPQPCVSSAGRLPPCCWRCPRWRCNGRRGRGQLERERLHFRGRYLRDRRRPVRARRARQRQHRLPRGGGRRGRLRLPAIWITLAVGIIGNEDNSANWTYIAMVVLVAITASAVAARQGAADGARHAVALATQACSLRST